jgi:hypothetical protein
MKRHYLVHTRGHSYAFTAEEGKELQLPPRLRKRVAAHLKIHDMLLDESVTIFQGSTGIVLQRVRPDWSHAYEN